MKRVYAWRCKDEDCATDEFDSYEMRGEVCPRCGGKAIRIFDATNTFRPSASPVKLHLNTRAGKKRGWRR